MSEPTPAYEFPKRQRHDGWTPVRQCIFLDTLVEEASVGLAIAAAGMGPSGVYAARRRYPAFNLAWQAALRLARDCLFDRLMDRAMHGETHSITRYENIRSGTRPNYRLGFGLLDRIDKAWCPAEVQAVINNWDDFLKIIENGAENEEVRSFFEDANLEGLARDRIADLFPLPEDSAEIDDREFAVWEFTPGEWRCDFPPPDGFVGVQDGKFGDEHYTRTLTIEEYERILPEIELAAAPDREKLGRGIAAREDWLAGSGEQDSQERPIEVKSMDGLHRFSAMNARRFPLVPPNLPDAFNRTGRAAL